MSREIYSTGMFEHHPTAGRPTFAFKNWKRSAEDAVMTMQCNTLYPKARPFNSTTLRIWGMLGWDCMSRWQC